MERNDFYQALSAAPVAYDWAINDSNSITATVTRGKYKGQTFNPVTAVANYLGAGSFGSNKRETLKAGTALGARSTRRKHLRMERMERLRMQRSMARVPVRTGAHVPAEWSRGGEPCREENTS